MPLPLLVAAAAPYLVEMAKNGLGMLAGAIQAKGKEVIEQKLGVKIPESPAAYTPELVQKLKELEIQHEEFLINSQLEEKKIEAESEKAAQEQVTERWKVDMSSDSWLSKNVRPLTLVYWTVVISLLATSSNWLKVDPLWIDLIKYSYMAILTAYFVGRSAQHVTNMIKRKHK